MAIGVGVAPLLPLLAALAARYKAEKGLHWPARLAPYPLQLILLPGGEKALDPLARALDALGIPWLVDDRDERAGVKFNDADWIGAPLRLLLGRRSLEKGGVEARRAGQREGKILPLEAIPQWVQENLDGHSSAP
jgi:prolyl-tRNA synthetase